MNLSSRESSSRLLSVVTPCFNEEKNVREVYQEVRKAIEKLNQSSHVAYDYEHLFIDNASLDRTAEVLRQIASEDRRVKVILNARNFGQIRSPIHGILQAKGDAVVPLVADLQDPPAMIIDFVKKWEEGYLQVIAVKESSEESAMMFFIRKLYYDLIARLSETRLIKNHTGFGLYDRKIIDIMRQLGDPYPYFRGLLSEIGFEPYIFKYRQPARKRGITSNNFFRLYDYAMLGIVSHSKVPLRMAIFVGAITAFLSLIIGIGYLIAKLVFWNSFSLGTAPLVVGFFLFRLFSYYLLVCWVSMLVLFILR